MARRLAASPLLLVEDLDPGEVRYTLRLSGFKDMEVKGLIQPGEQTFMEARCS